MAYDTIFHKIMRREIPADIVYEDDDMIAFRDIAPQAPIHLLAVPKRHIASIAEVRASDRELLGALNSSIVRIRERDPLFDEFCRIALARGGLVLLGRSLACPPPPAFRAGWKSDRRCG